MTASRLLRQGFKELFFTEFPFAVFNLMIETIKTFNSLVCLIPIQKTEGFIAKTLNLYS